jgi:hypothetical protein
MRRKGHPSSGLLRLRRLSWLAAPRTAFVKTAQDRSRESNLASSGDSSSAKMISLSAITGLVAATTAPSQKSRPPFEVEYFQSRKYVGRRQVPPALPLPPEDERTLRIGAYAHPLPGCNKVKDIPKPGASFSSGRRTCFLLGVGRALKARKENSRRTSGLRGQHLISGVQVLDLRASSPDWINLNLKPAPMVEPCVLRATTAACCSRRIGKKANFRQLRARWAVRAG